MSRINIKSVFLGIGIGIILTAFISMIYFAGQSPKMSKDEIQKKALEMGMVWPKDAKK